MQGNVSSTVGTLIHQLLRTGNLKEAEKYKDAIKVYAENKGEIGWESAAVFYARLLLFLGDFNKAQELLLSSEKVILSYKRIKSLITVYILPAEVLKSLRLTSEINASEFVDKLLKALH